MKIIPNQDTMGARIVDIDLAGPLSDRDFATVFQALCEHELLCFPEQNLSPLQQKQFSARFGSLQASPTGIHCETGLPEVTILSNIVENGKALGAADAGQDWHTDMSYNAVIGFTNILYAIEVPHRDGKPRGNTVFADMIAAYDDLPEATKTRIENLVAIHDFDKFWEEMRRRPGSTRGPMTAAMRASLPASRHQMVLKHPVTGAKILYANPGYVVGIEGMDKAESEPLLEELFAHQLQPKYQYTHRWAVSDVLMWDHISTLHNAIPDYGPTERRLIKRCQVMADRVFDPAFVAQILAPLQG